MDKDVKDLRDMFQLDWDNDRENRSECEDDLSFVAGEQWDAADRNLRENAKKAVLTINRMPQFIRQVAGDLRLARPSIRVRPVGAGADEDLADVYNGLIRKIEQQSSHNQPYMQAVESAIRCGIGHFRIRTDYAKNNPFHQEAYMEPIHNPLAVTWDMGARAVTREDAEHCWVREALPKEAYKKMYDGATEADFGETEGNYHHEYWYEGDKILIAEYWYKQKGTAPFILLEDGSVMRLDRLPTNVSHNTLDQTLLMPDGTEIGIEDTKDGEITLVKWKKMSGHEILETGDFPASEIPIIPVVGEEIHFDKKVIRSSLIRWARDPQRMYNLWRSVQTDTMASSPKAPYIVGASQIKGFERIWSRANTGDIPYLPYNDKDSVARPTREAPPPASSGMAQEIQLAAEDMKATTGIFDAGLGAQGNETSGIAIRQRQLEGDVSNNYFSENLRASLTRAGNILLEVIPQIYDSKRIVRVVSEDNSDEQIEINGVETLDGVSKAINDLTIGQYDLVVEMGPAFSTKRQEAIEGMRDLLQGIPGSNMYVDIIAKNSDWPGKEEFAERAQKLLPPGILEENVENLTDEEKLQKAQQQQQAQQLQQLQQQLQLADIQGDLREKAAKALKTENEAEKLELENLMSRLDLSTLSGGIQQALLVAIQQALAAPPDQQQPQQQSQPAPPGAGFFNA